MTQEEKAKAYDKAFEAASKIYANMKEGYNFGGMEDLEVIFPELAESEDERIRKELVNFVKSRLAGFPDCKRFTDWLEKQGEQRETLCTKCRKEQPSHSCQDITELGRCALEKQCEQKVSFDDFKAKDWYVSKVDGKIHNIHQDYNSIDPHFGKPIGQKPVDKVEPKFKVGDWIVNEFGDSWHIDSLDKIIYHVSDGKGNYDYIPILKQDEMHLWDITNAKPGDVLADKITSLPSPFIAIFKKKDSVDTFSSHCFIGFDGKFYEGEDEHSLENIHPATKEQREQLEKAMADAGFTFDFEKKELKKIEQKSATMSFDEAIEHCKEKSCGNNACALEHNQLEKWLTELKELKEQKPTWSKEDEMIALSIEQVMNCAYLLNIVPEKIDKIRTWLKSLKDRVGNFDDGYKVGFSAAKHNQWKPSDEQVEVLSIYAHVHDVLASLYQDLKKLKG